MAHTIQEALHAAGLVDTERYKTLAPEPSMASRRHGLPKWLTRNGLMTGPISDLIDPLRLGTHQAWLINEHARTYAEVIDIEPTNNPRLLAVQLAGEDESRTFRADVKVRYVLTR